MCSTRAWRATLLAVALGLFASRAQAAGTSGTDFFTCWMDTVDRTNDFAIAVANDATTTASVEISSPSRVLASASLLPGDVRVFRFPVGDRNAPQRLAGTRRGMLTYRVTSDVPVAVYQFNTWLLSELTESHTHDAATVLPLRSLGSRYRVTAWPEVAVQGLPQASLIAVIGVTAEPAAVVIRPTAPVKAGDLPASPAGTPISLTLQQGEVVQLASDAVGSDFTGTVVQADRPIAVFGGSACSQVPAGFEWCDHLEEQFLPTQSWGRELIAPKSKMRGSIPDYWRVLAARDGTTVTLTPDPAGPGPHVLAAGEHLQFSATSDVHVVATEPVQVTQYFAGSTFGGLRSGPGDPSLFLVVPTEQFETDFLFVTPQYFADDNVMIVAPSGTSVSLDGTAVGAAAFTPVGTTGYSKAIVPVADGAHAVLASAPSMVYAFGYDTDTSYAYYAGGLPLPIGSSIACNVTQTTPGPCDGGRVTLDASGSVGPPPLSYSWSAFTPGLTFATPTAATTSALVPAGGATAAVTISGADDSVTCWVEIPPPPPPAPPPDVACPARVTATATLPGGATVVVTASATGACEPVTVVNDRTSGGTDATDFYPCGTTTVRFTATDAVGQRATCTTRVEVTNAGVPPEVSPRGAGVPMRITRVAGDAMLRISFEDLADPLLRYNLYGGAVPPDGLRGRYGHAPIDCSFDPAPIAPGTQERLVPFVAGANRYFLVSASHCGGEGTRGFRSDGVERPALPTDCGLAR